MPSGQPDYGMYAVKETVSSLADLGELAARLGSIVTFDRRGDVMWYEDFEGAFGKWIYAGGLVGVDAYITAERANRGSFCCKLITGSADPYTVTIAHAGFGLAHSKIGVECAFTISNSLEYFQLRFHYYAKPTEYRAYIQYLPETDCLQYYNTAEGWTTFATDILLYPSDTLFHVLKFVIDLPNAKYNRVLLDNLPFDLSSIPLYTDTTVEAPNFSVGIYTKARVAANIVTYVDDVIVTQNEP